MVIINGKKYHSFSEDYERDMKDPEYRARYEALKPRFDLISALIDLRNEGKITQSELARLLKTKQPSIARLESGKYGPSLEFAQRVALSIGKMFVLRDLPSSHVMRKRKKR